MEIRDKLKDVSSPTFGGNVKRRVGETYLTGPERSHQRELDRRVERPRSRRGLWIALTGVGALILFGVLSSRDHQTGVAERQGSTISTSIGADETGFGAGLVDRSVALPKTYTFNSLSFEPGTTTPKSSSNAAADALASALKRFPTARIRVQGSAENSGNPAIDQKLAMGRAAEVKRMLLGRGIDGARIDAGGDAQPGNTTQVELLSR
jgi:outer membrane protein OmpA-like peptidoglycan-associated protein